MRTLILFGSAAACRTNYYTSLTSLTCPHACWLPPTFGSSLRTGQPCYYHSLEFPVYVDHYLRRKNNNITSLQHQIHLQPDHDKEWHVESRARMQIRNANATASTCRYHLSHHPLAKHCPQHGRVECIQRYIQLLHGDGISYSKPSY